jgi:hypothetical protein
MKEIQALLKEYSRSICERRMRRKNSLAAMII